MANAAASVNDFGRFSKITVYPRFADLGTMPTPTTRIELKFAGRLEIDARANGDLMRAIAILHEVGHLTGVEPAHERQTDDLGHPVTPDLEEGLYNTRILNVCFTPVYLISSFSCTQIVHGNSVYDYSTTLDCFAGCRTQFGPMANPVKDTKPVSGRVRSAGRRPHPILTVSERRGRSRG